MPSVGVTPPSWALAVALCVEAVGEEPWEASLCALPRAPFPLAEAAGEFCALPPSVWAVQEVRVRLNRAMRATADTLMMGPRMTGPPTALFGMRWKEVYLLIARKNEPIPQVVTHRSSAHGNDLCRWLEEGQRESQSKSGKTVDNRPNDGRLKDHSREQR